MATKSIILSDIGGAELTDETHSRVVIRHPDYSTPLEIDISTEEAGKLVETTLRLVSFEIHEPNRPVRTVTAEIKQIDKIFPTFADALGSARRVQERPSENGQRKVRGTAPKADKGDRLDYTSPEHAGKLHRGRITDEEAQFVRANRDVASKNRQEQTGSPIDFADPKEIKRYGLS